MIFIDNGVLPLNKVVMNSAPKFVNVQLLDNFV